LVIINHTASVDPRSARITQRIFKLGNVGREAAQFQRVHANASANCSQAPNDFGFVPPAFPRDFNRAHFLHAIESEYG